MTTSPPSPNLLADSRAAAEELLGHPAWSRGPWSGSPEEGRIWGTLAGASPALAAELDQLPRGLRAYVVDHAGGSQFEALRGLGPDLGPLTPLVCLARTGEGFRGQRGRSWEACRGNLHLSFALSPGRSIRELGVGLSMLPAVATVDCIEEVSAGALSPGIKWVNDILLEGQKVAGVISASQVRGERVEIAQLGIGLNVGLTPVIERDPFVPAAGCLGLRPDGEPFELSQVCLALLRALIDRYQALVTRGPGELFERYCGRSLIINRAVRIWSEEHPPPAPPTHRGVVEAIEPDLTLRIRGCREPVSRGRLAFDEACRDLGLR